MAMDQIGLQYYIDLTKLNAGVKAVKSKIDALNKSITGKGIKDVAIPISGVSAELQKMGVTSSTTTTQFQKMNFEVADHAKIAKLTRLQIKELESSMASSGKATAAQAHQFNRLGKRLEHSEYQVRKQTSAMGDARRAQERWGAGFKYMMLSQTAWIASGAIIFGTLGAITKALQGFLDFNQGLVDAAAITQATSSGYERMGAAAMKAFKSSTMGIQETTEALKILGQAGMDATAAAIALETVYKVTTATGGSTTEVVKFLTTAINVWKLSAEDAAKVGNILGAALNYSKLEVEDLGVTFNYVASIAKTVGMSITELAATMAVMANAGIKASTIGTGLRGVMSKLISGSPKLTKELAKVGLKFEDVSLTTHSLMEALETLSKAGFDLKNIFTGLRRREAAALNVMLEQGVERFKLMTAALKDTTAIEVMFERSMRGMKNQLILTGHQIQAVLIDALKVSQPIVIGITKSIQALIDTLRELAPLLIGLGVSFVAWKIGAIIMVAITAKLTAGFTAATIAAGAFSKILMIIKAHPILAFLALLIGGYTAVKAIIDATTVSIKEQLNQLNREIDDTRKLQILLMDSNRTNEEKLRILADYAKDYPSLLKFLDQEKIKIEDITKLISKENEMRKEKILRLKQEALARLKERLAYTELAYGEDYDPSKESRWKKWLKLTGEDVNELRNQIRLLEFQIASLEGKAPEISMEPEAEMFKWTAGMEKALEKLRYEQSSAKEQAYIDLIEGLVTYGMVENEKTGLTKNQLEARELLYKEYNNKINEIDEKADKDRQKLIDKALKDTEKRVKAREKAEVKSIKIVGKLFKDYEKLQNILTKKLIDIEEDGYEKRIKLWERENKIQRKRYADLLEAAKDYYDELMEKAIESPVFELQAEKIAKLIIKIKELQSQLGLITSGGKPISPSNYAKGMIDGLEEFGKELANEYETWKDLTKDIAVAMRDTLSDVFFDSMTGELKSAGDYWRAFTTTVKRLIAEMAAQWLMFQAVGTMGKTASSWGLVGSLLSSHKGGLIKTQHEGGLIKKMHSGGLAPNETMRILKDREYVIKDSSVRSLGVANLDYQNQTGKLPPAAPQQVIHKYYNYIYAIDSESMDVALRKHGAGAISDISLNANAYGRMRRDPRAGRG